jgi:uncharacterized membrane protein YfcA
MPFHPAWAIVLLAIFLIGVTKSGFGSGAGLMIPPLTALALSYVPGQRAENALPLLLPLLITGDLIAIWQYRRHVSASIIKRLLPGSIVGIVLGSLLLWSLHRLDRQKLVEAIINIEIGAESIVLVSLHWYRQWRERHGVPVYRPSLVKSTAVGAFAGVSSTLAHAAGPIIALHLLPQRLERGVFVGTCAIYFFIINTAKMPGYWLSGTFKHISPLTALAFSPLVILGAIFGFVINRKMSDKVFSKTVYAITFILGGYILYRGISQLLR